MICIALTFSSGEIYGSDTRDSNIMLGKNFIDGCLHAFDTLEASRHGTSPFHSIHHIMGLSSGICAFVPMPEAGSMGSYAKQML